MLLVPARRFGLSAMEGSGSFNGGRTAYVPNSEVSAIQRKLRSPVPLVLHVVAGECVTVDLTNLLPPPEVPVGSPPLPPPPVGFSVGKLDREAGSGGVNVGFAPDQNVAPGATRQYVYYVPTDRIGTAVIADLAGATTLKQGLYGAVVVAPASKIAGEQTQFRDPTNGLPKDIGAQVLVRVPGAATPEYRDFTVTMADDDDKIGQDFMPYPTNADVGRSLINYQAAPAGDGPTAFRDPGDVPWLTAYAGDPMTVHVLVAPGSEGPHVFSLGGLRWEQDPHVDNSNSLTAQGMGPWETFDAKVIGGAGGTQQAPGDYFYGDLRRPFTQIGLWGLQRVLPTPSTCPAPGSGIQCLQPPNTAPGAPAIGTATAGDRSATVSWTPPAANGGSAITSYEIVATPSAGPAMTRTGISATATSGTVSGLTNGTAYTLQVRAVNAAGSGALSAASTVVTPDQPPPGGGGGGGGTPPPGGGGGTPPPGGGGGTPPPGGGGGGGGTPPPGTVPPATVPRAPGIRAATAANASALVRWTAPANGGSAITRYSVKVVRAANGAQVGPLRSATVGATSLRVTGLVNGTAVRFQVRATNSVGTGGFSARSNAVTPRTTVPGAPVIGPAKPGATGAAITARANWSSMSNGGLAIKGYVVTALRMSATGRVLSQTTSAVRPATARSLAMTLPAGNYRFVVRARNLLGLGAASLRSNLVTAR